MNSTEENKTDVCEEENLTESEQNSEEAKAIDKDEAIDNLDQLFDGKEKAINEFDAHGNIAQTQAFFQNVQNLQIYMANSKPVKPKLPLDKKYNLCNQEECIEFIEKFKYGEYLAVAIILCTFQMISMGDMPNLQKKLMEYLPLANKEEEDMQSIGGNPYLSIDSILAVIGGRRFTTGTGQQCITLGENSKKALANIVEQFPMLRQFLVEWLLDVNSTYEYHTTLGIYQIVTALTRVIALDIRDAEHRIFPYLYSRPENVVLLGSLFFYLYEYEEIRNKVKEIYRVMLQSNEIWLLQVNCVACYFFAEGNLEFPLEKDLQKAIIKNWMWLDRPNLYYWAGVLFNTKKFRDVVINSFSIIYSKLTDKEKKLLLVQKYLILIQFGYYQVKPSRNVLPLVACDSKEQQEKIGPLLQHIMWIRRLRKSLYVVLEAYMKELTKYKVSDRLLKHIAGFIYNLTLAGTDYKEDILEWLEQLDNDVANEILKIIR